MLHIYMGHILSRLEDGSHVLGGLINTSYLTSQLASLQLRHDVVSFKNIIWSLFLFLGSGDAVLVVIIIPQFLCFMFFIFLFIHIDTKNSELKVSGPL